MSRMITTLILSLFYLCFISILLPTSAQAIPLNSISQVYFFGDSLTDSGFNDLFPEPNPSKAPTFTTLGGYTWSQYIARDIKGFLLPVYPGPNPPDLITNNLNEETAGAPVSGTKNGIDYAAGGSTTNSIGVGGFPWAPSLHRQIAMFLTQHPHLDPNALYFIWSGANDILALIFAAPPIPTQLQLLLAANTAATNIANEVALLYAHGARRVVVLSLPNIGWTPLIATIAAANNVPTLPGAMKNITFTFNSMLNQKLGKVIQQTGVKILYEDVYDLLENVVIATKAGKPYVVAGQSFKFTNYTGAACGSPLSSAIVCNTGSNGFIFADGLHPTDMSHRLLSLQVEQDIQNWN